VTLHAGRPKVYATAAAITRAGPAARAIVSTAANVSVATGARAVSVLGVRRSGVLSPVPCAPASDCTPGFSPGALATTHSGRFLYATNRPSDSVVAVRCRGGRIALGAVRWGGCPRTGGAGRLPVTGQHYPRLVGDEISPSRDRDY
jgi:hypothetical protein